MIAASIFLIKLSAESVRAFEPSDAIEKSSADMPRSVEPSIEPIDTDNVWPALAPIWNVNVALAPKSDFVLNSVVVAIRVNSL